MTATLIQNQSSGILLNNISWKTYEFLLNELAQQRGIRLTYDRGKLEIMTRSAPHEKYKILLNNISWKTYESLLNELAQQPGIRLTYDRGNLEIMTPSAPHEKSGELLGNFVEVLTDELNVDICSLGSLTCKRQDLARGLEPDKCYYIQNEDAVWNKEQIDLNEDPPPDLAIEIDITSSSLDRLELYASLGVPEVWRYDGNRLIIYHLEGNEYAECEVSPTFPFLLKSEMLRFLELRRTTKEKALLRLFREWVRSQIQFQP